MNNTNITNRFIPKQKKERYYGNREYKLYLSNRVYDIYSKAVDDNLNDNILHISDYDETETENENGNVNHKLDLEIKTININKLNKRATQLLFRLNEGKGKAIYMFGIDDNGNNVGINLKLLLNSYEYLQSMCKLVNASYSVMNIYKGKNGFIGSVRLHIPNYSHAYNILSADYNSCDENYSENNTFFDDNDYM